MSQSRTMSAVEALTNTIGGLLIALVCQVTLFVWLGIQVSAGQNVVIVAVMMVQSLIRQYAFRRCFEAVDRWLTRRRLHRWSVELEAEVDAQTATRLLQG